LHGSDMNWIFVLTFSFLDISLVPFGQTVVGEVNYNLMICLGNTPWLKNW